MISGGGEGEQGRGADGGEGKPGAGAQYNYGVEEKLGGETRVISRDGLECGGSKDMRKK